jgi:hypothetical protein
LASRPLCLGRLLNELRPYRSEPMYGAAPFFAAGMTAATIASYQPFFKVDRSIHAMADQAVGHAEHVTEDLAGESGAVSDVLAVDFSRSARQPCLCGVDGGGTEPVWGQLG